MMKREWSSVRVLAALAVALFGLTGCLGSNDSDTAGAKAALDRPLRLSTSWEITSVDPVSEGFWASGFGYGELFLRPTPSGEPKPWILKSAESVSPTQWKLEVNEGVTFQNGNPCDAKAVAAAINHQIANNPILKPVLPGAVAKATGPTMVTLTTKSPVSFVPDLLAQDNAFPVYDVKAYEAAEGDKQAMISAGLYTGPYEVKELTAQHLVLKRNRKYWQGVPALPGVELQFIADAQARILAVESGESDIALHPPTEAARSLEHSQTAHYVTAREGTWGPRLTFNMDQTPIDDVLVRRAFSAAVDYEAIANEVMDGKYAVAKGMYPMHLPYAVANQKHDPDAARALLDEAGWTESGSGARTKDGQKLELTLVTYRTDPDMQPIAVAMRSQLEQVGIGVKIREIDASTQLYDEDFNDWDAALILSGYFGLTGNVVGVIHDYLTSEGANNWGGVSDPKIDAIADELSQAFDRERRNDLLRELQDVAVRQNAYLVVPGEKKADAIVSDAWADYVPSLNYVWVDWQTAP